MVDFLAFLVPELRLKNPNFVTNQVPQKAILPILAEGRNSPAD